MRVPGPETDVMETARERFRFASEAEATQRKLQLEDKQFAAGNHWPESIRRQREEDGRPCLVVDRLTPQIKQVTNQLRQNRPSITVSPVDNGADVETAEVLQGVIRHIEQNSDADVAYDCAAADAATIGIGYFRILTCYEGPDKKRQEIKIDRVRNRFSVYMDPTCQKIDFSDARFAFVTEDLPKSEYDRLYKDSQAASLTDFSAIGDYVKDWFTENTVRIAEYWYVEGDDDNRKVFCKKINGLEVLESYDWMGKYIPFIPVIGEEVDLAGKVDYRGITRRAKDPMRMSDFWKSAATEAIALAPKAPYIVAEGQIDAFTSQWALANVKNFVTLTYTPKTVGGELAPPPRRDVSEPPIQAIMQAIVASENDLRAVTGFYDVESNDRKEQSGRAILARQRQGELGNSDYADGLRRAVRACARQLIDLIPKIYDVPRIRRIIGKDGKAKTVVVHAGQAEAAQQYDGQDGIEGIYDLGVGQFDVVVSAGENYQTARQEFVELMSGIYQSRPELFQLTGDLFFENMDIPFAKQMAERMKKLLPPQLQDESDQNAIPPQVQQAIAERDQAIQQLQQALQEAQSGLAAKQLETESRERITAAELDTKERLAAMELQFKQLKAHMEAATKMQMADAETDRAMMRVGHEQKMKAVDLLQEQAMADTDHINQMEATDRAAAHKMQEMRPRS